MSVRQALRNVAILICSVAIVVSSGQVVSAITAAQKTILNRGIRYYNECLTSGGSSAIGDNKDYKGNPILSEDQLAKIKELQPFYETAANKVGIPWQLLAVVHILEHNQGKDGPSNGQGPYQDYERNNIPASLNVGGNWKTGAYSDSEFQDASDWAANDLKRRAGDRDLNDDNVVKDLFFAYNGKAGVYKRQALNLGFDEEGANRGEGSPYVMNRADKKRDPTDPETATNNTWGQIKTDGGGITYPANKHYGAYVMYAGLKGGSSDSSTSSNKAADDGHYIWVGDSRTEGMSNAIKDGDNDWVAKVSSGYDWFNSEAAQRVTDLLDEDTTIVFNFGVNDLGNIDKYINKLNELAGGDWSKAKQIIVMSVNPVDETAAKKAGYSVTNAQIEEFNNKMKTGITSKIKYVDMYSKIKDKIKTSDGIHYENETYQEIYNSIRGSGSNEGSSCNGTSSSAGNGDIAETAISMSWPDDNHHDEIKPEYLEGLKQVQGTEDLSVAQDCGRFVGTVMRYSGADPDFPTGGSETQENYMKESDKYEKIENTGSEDNLQPGDIFAVNAPGGAASGHILIYIGDHDGFKIASASLYQRTANLGKTVPFEDSLGRGTYSIYRLKQ